MSAKVHELASTVESVANNVARTMHQSGVLMRAATRRIDALNAERDSLRSILEIVYGHLGAANSQRSPSDDRIIADHVADALRATRAALLVLA